MIEFLNVSKSYWTGTRRKVILDQATFRIELGRSIGILAPNGTGKTTIVNMMAGLIRPDEGEIRRRSRISFPLGFNGTMNTALSAAENVRFAAQFYGVDPDYVEAFCRHLCDIEEYFEQPVKTYSAGMRSRLSLTLLLALEFDIYLVDEGMPSTLSSDFVRKVGPIMEKRFRNSTLVMVSHVPKVLDRYCRSAAVLWNGRLRFFDRLEDAKRVYAHVVESSQAQRQVRA
ncbi:MAG: ATP-binding cassette domain-containing protein [Pseudomonadota bacterium]